jgi:hypothetical protein
MNNSLNPHEKSWVETQMVEAEKKWLKMQQDLLNEILDGNYLKWLSKPQSI